MNGTIALVVLASFAGLAVACTVSQNGVLRAIGAFVFGALSIAFAALTIFLVHVGVRNNWSSDGPGMLFVMIAICVFGLVAVGLLRFAFGLLFGDRREP